MIFDRTPADVSKAVSIRKNKLAQGVEITQEEAETLERGSFTVSTANRIELKQSEIKNILDDLGYYASDVANKQWEVGDFFYDSDLQRIVYNTIALKNAFFVYSDSPSTPRAEYHYREINIMEKLLYDLQEMANFLVANIKECDTFDCGED